MEVRCTPLAIYLLACTPAAQPTVDPGDANAIPPPTVDAGMFADAAAVKDAASERAAIVDASDARDASDGTREACERGDAWACYLARESAEYEVDRVRLVRRALTLGDAACSRGDVTGCFVVGHACRSACEGGDLDFHRNGQKAMRYLDKACQGNVAMACYDLAQAIREKEAGFPTDPARARTLEERAKKLDPDVEVHWMSANVVR